MKISPSRVYVLKSPPPPISLSNYPIMALAGAAWWTGAEPTLAYIIRKTLKDEPDDTSPGSACHRLTVRPMGWQVQATAPPHPTPNNPEAGLNDLQ